MWDQYDTRTTRIKIIIRMRRIILTRQTADFDDGLSMKLHTTLMRIRGEMEGA